MKLNRKILCVLAIASCVTPAFSDEGKKTYLALGDSIPFGFNPTLFGPPGTPLPTPAQFVGYPEIVSTWTGTPAINAACPGETSASFLVFGAPDNGCNGFGPQGQPPFKPVIGLHTNYSGTQMQFALDQLRTNESIKLVTLNIGGNDLSLLEMSCAVPPADFEKCVTKGLKTVLPKYRTNLNLILDGLRNQAKYQGLLILVTTYSPSADPLFVGAVFALNKVLIEVGKKYKVSIADGFGAFQLVSASSGGDPCAAQLLIALPPGYPSACDIHPSKKGQDLLAATVLLAMKNSSLDGGNGDHNENGNSNQNHDNQQ